MEGTPLPNAREWLAENPALLAAALRMLPADNTPQGEAKRIVRQAEAKSAGFDHLEYD